MPRRKVAHRHAGPPRHALEFFRKHLPFAEMRHADELTSAPDDYCFAKPGSVYAIYLPGGGTTKLKLPAGTFTVKWYDPRRGGGLSDGSVTSVRGPGDRAVGRPPRFAGRDWVVLVKSAR